MNQQEELEEAARHIGNTLRQSISNLFGPNSVGFCLCLFDYSTEGHTVYIADGKHQDLIRVVDILAEKLKENLQ